MQRTFITEQPDTLQSHQIVVDLPRYEVPLTKSLLRHDLTDYSRFQTDDAPINIITSLNQVKKFVDELALLDPSLDVFTRVPYGVYAGVQFTKSQDAVQWARSFVRKWFPRTEEFLLKQALLSLPLQKTEIVWLGGERYLSFVQSIATSPETVNLVQNAKITAEPALTVEAAAAKRAEIAARRSKKDTVTNSPAGQ
jgi:hypothetical protein